MTWRKVALGELLVPSKNLVSIEPEQRYKQITVRLWGKGLTLRGACDGVEIAARKQIQARSGEFLISKIDARHGAFGLVPDDLDGAVVSNDFPCFLINRDYLEPRFLNWYSKTTNFVSLCKQSSIGSTNRVRLKEGRFLELEIPLPSLDEQHAIAKQLDEIQIKIQKRHLALEEIARDTGAMLFNSFKKLVESAEYIPLPKVAPLVRRVVDINPDDAYPELGVRSFGKGTFHKPAIQGFEVSDSKTLHQIRAGDLVINLTFAWEGAVAVASDTDHGRYGSQRFLTFVPNPDMATSNFIAYYLLTDEGLSKLNAASPGSAGRNRVLGTKRLHSVTVPIPKINAQLQFDALCKKVRKIHAIRASTAADIDSLIPAMLHNIFEHKQHTTIGKLEGTNKVVRLPLKQTTPIDSHFKEAVLVGAIIKKFSSDDQPLGNFRLQKGVYFARRHMGEKALDQEFLRKVAGPYNPSMRYSGGISIALKKNWIVPASGKQSNGHVLGTAANDLDRWINEYQFGKSAAWVYDKFKYRKNEQWEILATVDYAILALTSKNNFPTASDVLEYISNDKEWAPKLEKLKLSEAVIHNSMIELQSLFSDAVTP
jgi:type I restriction enzyme S subunit